jgi:hypothetical protein
MSWGLTAVAGATVLSAGMSRNAAKGATNAASDASAAELAFAQEQYDDWKEVYGPLQDNLSEYYTNLTPEFYEAVGLENLESQLQISNQRLDEMFAQRGIDPSSGIAASIEAQGELDAAEARAGIRRDAERQVAEDKTRFLQIGLGQNPASSVQNTLARQSSTMQQQANLANQAAGQAVGSAIQTIGTGISDYVTKNTLPAK